MKVWAFDMSVATGNVCVCVCIRKCVLTWDPIFHELRYWKSHPLKGTLSAKQRTQLGASRKQFYTDELLKPPGKLVNINRVLVDLRKKNEETIVIGLGGNRGGKQLCLFPVKFSYIMQIWLHSHMDLATSVSAAKLWPLLMTLKINIKDKTCVLDCTLLQCENTYNDIMTHKYVELSGFTYIMPHEPPLWGWLTLLIGW